MKNLEYASVSHEERLIEELRADPEFAQAYLAAAMEEEIPVILVTLRQLAEAYGGMTRIAEEAGVAREALYRALSPKGNPTLKTITAVLKAIGMRLDVAPLGKEDRKAA
ncbi:MAG: addiction module antidote protein [Sulfuricella sp.]